MKLLKILSLLGFSLIVNNSVSNFVELAVIPCAGLGTRLLPLSKAVPKELVPILDKPAIEYVVQEAINSNLKKFCIVTNPDKVAIEKYFSHNYKLERELKNKGKLHLLANLNQIIDKAKFVYPNQLEPLGLGHAVLMAKKYVKTDFFAVLLPDDIYNPDHKVIGTLLKKAQEENTSIIAVQEVPQNKVSSYGIISYKNKLGDNLFEISNVVEKPSIDKAPTNLAIVGRYILHKDIFSSIEKIAKATQEGEIQLTDAIADMIANGHKVLALKINETRHDVGNLEGLIKANFDVGTTSSYSHLLK